MGRLPLRAQGFQDALRISKIVISDLFGESWSVSSSILLLLLRLEQLAKASMVETLE